MGTLWAQMGTIGRIVLMMKTENEFLDWDHRNVPSNITWGGGGGGGQYPQQKEETEIDYQRESTGDLTGDA